jgi:hypothetical protein
MAMAFVRYSSSGNMSAVEDMASVSSQKEEGVDPKEQEHLSGASQHLQYLAQDTFSTQRERQQQWQWQQQEQKAQESGDNEEAQVGRLIGACKAHFHDGEFNMRLLFAMAYGIEDKDGRVIADWEGEPYMLVKKTNKKTFKPTKEQLWTKVECHADALGLPVPQIKSSGMDVKKEWLANNPHTNQNDIAFLMEKDEHFMKSCLAVEEEDQIRRELQN